jgi:hypothetical protein
MKEEDVMKRKILEIEGDFGETKFFRFLQSQHGKKGHIEASPFSSRMPDREDIRRTVWVLCRNRGQI